MPSLYQPLSNKRFYYLSSIKGKGGIKDISCISQSYAIFVSLVCNLFCLYLLLCQITKLYNFS